MRYLIADIHGCYEEYQELLKRLRFSDEDDLYVLGDAMDRGPEPIRVIQDLMARPNVIYILGNHDYSMLQVMRRLAVEVTEENYGTHLSEEDLLNYSYWLQDGGDVTARAFAALPREEQADILEYLEDAYLYEVLEEGEKTFVLVHAGIDHFEEGKDLEEYEFFDFLFTRPDYSRRYFPGEHTYLVTGHTPTMNLNPDRRPVVYQANGHIALDCGCVFGGRLAAYCVETGEITYVESRTRGEGGK